MTKYQFWDFPDMPEEIAELLLQDDKKVVIVGVIGKSAFPDCNKMTSLNVLDRHPSLLKHEPREGQIQFYYNHKESMLILHFETSFDTECMQQMIKQQKTNGTYEHFLLFNQDVRSRFGRMFLFATLICHIIVFVELNVNFDASLVPMFKALRIIRDRHILKFLPKLMKNSSTGAILGKPCRVCSARLLFFFEQYPNGYERSKDAISKLEFEVEDNIYKMLRNEYIIMNNSSLSLFSIPSNKRFVYYNTDENIREDPLVKSVGILESFLQKATSTAPKDSDDDDRSKLEPFPGFGRPLAHCKTPIVKRPDVETFSKERSFMDLLKEHVEEAMSNGFDDNIAKFKNKGHFVLPSAKAWYETFKVLYKILIQNPDDPNFDAKDADYKAYLDNFNKIMNVDNEFFSRCCDIGLQKAFSMYNNPALTHYSAAVHKKLTQDAIAVYHQYARGPYTSENELKLVAMCDDCWRNGKQQCEVLSLRGNPCVILQHIVKDPSEHSSGLVFVSSCNCGRSQGRREDPYTLRHANYEFYEYMANNCNLCAKVKKIHFAIFEPSINDYRAAEFERQSTVETVAGDTSERRVLKRSECFDKSSDGFNDQPLTAASQSSHDDLSLASLMNDLNLPKAEGSDDDDFDDESVNELVLRVKDKETQEEEERERSIYRQPSTTEFLPGMVHTTSPIGLLPLFPSWSLVCVGASSIYSHNTGLQEHFQSGFISGTNFLLPWDVHVRLEHSAAWAAAYEKSRYRKLGEVIILKIFVGYEYECPRGHRFMMSAPDKVLRGGSSGISRDSGSKVVYNNMPLYFPCPCRSSKQDVAQLMRVHVVTPKAPVNVILDPKVRTGDYDYVFTLGLTNPPKLSQSAYWILRLPYVYQGDDIPIPPPSNVNASNAINYGCLQAGMFGVSETEVED